MIYRKKCGDDGTLVMTNRLYEMFKRRKAQATDEWVFPTKRRWNNAQWLQHALVRIGITQDAGRITLHTARHTAASRLIKGGLSLLEVQQYFGHKDVQSTMCYSHIETGAVAEKAATLLNRPTTSA
ncbi:tyrosine-type recombinase/integrase [Ramlibacter sp. MMS24-I3-19]|uniref:tyrosine-type recombinase/integrase n=1 Tax=Ramlibacter sp. MMS24-I3-19 TaxID=3416606 RepID=UPI003D00B7B7